MMLAFKTVSSARICQRIVSLGLLKEHTSLNRIKRFCMS